VEKPTFVGWIHFLRIRAFYGKEVTVIDVTPLFQHRISNTFVSSVDIGSMNLLWVHFHLILTLFLYILRAEKHNS